MVREILPLTKKTPSTNCKPLHINRYVQDMIVFWHQITFYTTKCVYETKENRKENTHRDQINNKKSICAQDELLRLSMKNKTSPNR